MDILEFLIKSSLLLSVALIVCCVVRFSAAQRHTVLVMAVFAMPMLAVLPSLPLPTISFDAPAVASSLEMSAPLHWIVELGESNLPQVVGGPAGKAVSNYFPQLAAGVSALMLLVWALRILATRWFVGKTEPVDLPRECYGVREVWQSERVRAPIVIGLLKPRIIVPQDWLDWSAQDRALVLEHELAHVRRYDVLSNATAGLILCFFWWQPLLWLVVRRLKLEAEQACDDAVVNRGVSAVRYAGQLVAWAKHTRLVGGVAMAAPHTLPVRIGALLNCETRRTEMTSNRLFRTALVAMISIVPLAVIEADVASLPNPFAEDAPLTPLVKVSPIYPQEARAQGVEGHVLVEFTVNELGRTQDARVVDASPKGIFDQAALDAVSHFKYRPQTDNGKSVSISGVRNRIAFRAPFAIASDSPRVKHAEGLDASVLEALTRVSATIDASDISSAAQQLKKLKSQFGGMGANEKSQVHNMAGYLAFSQANYPLAIQEYQAVLVQGNGVPAGLRNMTLFTLAQLTFVEADYESSLDYIDQWQGQAGAATPTPLIFKGQVHYHLRDFPAAIAHMERGIAAATDQDVAVKENWWKLLAFLYFEEKRWSELITATESLVEQYPKAEHKARLERLRRAYGHGDGDGGAA